MSSHPFLENSIHPHHVLLMGKKFQLRPDIRLGRRLLLFVEKEFFPLPPGKELFHLRLESSSTVAWKGVFPPPLGFATIIARSCGVVPRWLDVVLLDPRQSGLFPSSLRLRVVSSLFQLVVVRFFPHPAAFAASRPRLPGRNSSSILCVSTALCGGTLVGMADRWRHGIVLRSSYRLTQILPTTTITSLRVMSIFHSRMPTLHQLVMWRFKLHYVTIFFWLFIKHLQ